MSKDERNKSASVESTPSIPRRRSRGRIRRWIILLAFALLVTIGSVLFQRLETGKAKTTKPAAAPSAAAITTATAQKAILEFT